MPPVHVGSMRSFFEGQLSPFPQFPQIASESRHKARSLGWRVGHNCTLEACPIDHHAKFGVLCSMAWVAFGVFDAGSTKAVRPQVLKDEAAKSALKGLRHASFRNANCKTKPHVGVNVNGLCQ